MADLLNRKQDYIGSGIAFPLQINIQGEVELSSGKMNIEESIKIILQTNLGERVNRPDFGCRISELLFEPMNIDTMLLVRTYVEEALSQWETRIVVQKVIAEPDLDKSLVNIEIVYQERENRILRNMIYPFYMQSSTEKVSEEF